MGSDGADAPSFAAAASEERAERREPVTAEAVTGPPSGSWRRRRRGWGSAEDVEVGPPPPPDARPHGPTTGGFPVPGRGLGTPAGGFPVPSSVAPSGPFASPDPTDHPPSGTTPGADADLTPPHGFRAVGADMPGLDAARPPAPTLPPWRRPATPPWGLATGRATGRTPSTPGRPSASNAPVTGRGRAMSEPSDPDPDQAPSRTAPPAAPTGQARGTDTGTDRAEGTEPGSTPTATGPTPPATDPSWFAPRTPYAPVSSPVAPTEAPVDAASTTDSPDPADSAAETATQSGPGWRAAAAGAAGLGVAGVAAGTAAGFGDTDDVSDETAPSRAAGSSETATGTPADADTDESSSTTVSSGHGSPSADAAEPSVPPGNASSEPSTTPDAGPRYGTVSDHDPLGVGPITVHPDDHVHSLAPDSRRDEVPAVDAGPAAIRSAGRAPGDVTAADPDGADVPGEEPAGAPATDADAIDAATTTTPTSTAERPRATPTVSTGSADTIDRHRVAQGRIGIDEVTPEVSGGRFPSKAVVGEVVPVEATVWREGHDAVAATLVWQRCSTAGHAHVADVAIPCGDDAPRSTRMVPTGPLTDRFAGQVVPDAEGLWSFRVDAWSDPWATWRHAVEVKTRAGQGAAELSNDLETGARLLERAADGIEQRLRDTPRAAADDDPASERTGGIAMPPVLELARTLTRAAEDLRASERDLPERLGRAL